MTLDAVIKRMEELQRDMLTSEQKAALAQSQAVEARRLAHQASAKLSSILNQLEAEKKKGATRASLALVDEVISGRLADSRHLEGQS